MCSEGKTAEIDNLKKAIAALEAQRTVLGDSVTATATAQMKDRIARLEAPEAPSTSRRAVTVVLGDISGFASLGEMMDAEVLTDLMNEVWAVLDGVVTGHGGIVDKHMGDSILAIWGGRSTGENDAEMALRAALDMQMRLREMGGRFVSAPGFPAGRNLQMRIAVHSGPAFVGETGSRGEQTAMGDTMNTASRLERLAPLGGVLTSEETWKLVRDLFEGVEQAPVRLRGKSDELRTWVVGRALPRGFVDVTRGLGRGDVPMIGRDRELGILIRLFEKAEQPGSAGLAVIAGEGGIGKSRLLREFEKAASSGSPEAVFLRGRSTPEMASTPYGVVRDMVLAWLGLTESCASEDALGRIIELTGASLDSRRAESIVSLLGFGSPSSQTPLSAGGDLLFFFRKALGRSRAIMLLEDLHWADDATLRLVEMFVRERPGLGFLAVCTTRPAFFERAPRWGNPAAGHELIRLDPLDMDESRALMESILSSPGEVAADLSRVVHARADGNPFFIEEVLRMLLDGGVIRMTGDGWNLAGQEPDLPVPSIPPTLNGVLLARLDALPASEREMLQHASVIGREFWDSALAEVSGIPPAVVGETLGVLEIRQLIVRSPRSCFEGAAEFSFCHSLLREATYETVLLKRRREAHLRVASWLDRNAAASVDAFQATIAWHFEKAGQNEKAAERYLKAGDGAYGRNAFRDALRNFERGLATAGEAPGRIRALILAGKGSSLEKLSRYREAEKCLLEAVEAGKATSFDLAQGKALNALSRVYQVTGRYEEAESVAVEALEKARSSGDKQTLARSLSRMASYAGTEGYSHTHSFFQQALLIYRETADRPGQALCLLNMGITALDEKHCRDARKFFDESLSIYRAIDHAWGISNSLANIGLLEQRDGHVNEAIRLTREALRLSLEIGDHENAAICLGNIASAMRQDGRKTEALAYFIQSLQESLRIGAVSHAVEVMVETAGLLLELENPEWSARILSCVESSEKGGISLTRKAADMLEECVRFLLGPREFEMCVREGRDADPASLVDALDRALGRRDQPKL